MPGGTGFCRRSALWVSVGGMAVGQPRPNPSTLPRRFSVARMVNVSCEEMIRKALRGRQSWSAVHYSPVRDVAAVCCQRRIQLEGDPGQSACLSGLIHEIYLGSSEGHGGGVRKAVPSEFAPA